MSSSTDRGTIVTRGTGSLRDALVGAWRLASCVETDVATGEVFLPMGEQPQGFILYTLDGYMSAQLSASGRPSLFAGSLKTARITWYRAAPNR